MDWEMEGAIGETLGSAGVIATLLYVARQIHLAQVAAQREAAAELLSRTQAVISQISESVESVRIWRLGMSGDASLTVDELGKFRMTLYNLMLVWERMHHLEKGGSVEDWLFRHFRNSRGEFVCSPGFKPWWELRKHWFTEEFRDMIASEAAHAKPGVYEFPEGVVDGSGVPDGASV